MTRSHRVSWLVSRMVPAALAVFVSAVLIEHVLEVRDAARLTTDDTFSSVNGKRVRYRLVGADRPGPTIVLVSGLLGTVEQWHTMQDPLAVGAPVLSYDRAGTGFSEAVDAHDAEAEAEELAGLLRATRVSPPFVVVSYSASALLVRLFVAKNSDLVKGVVLLDPILPARDYVTLRGFASGLLESLVGILRLKGLRSNVPSPTRREEKEGAILMSFHHWYAAAAEGLSLGNWTQKILSAPAFGPIPVAVVCTFDPARDARNADTAANSRTLAAESPRGMFLASSLDHGTLFADPSGVSLVIDLVRTVEGQARALATHP